jgi:hypothetical protein
MNSEPRLPYQREPAVVESPDEASPGAAGNTYQPASRRPLPRVHLWLRRASVLLFVFLCATLGVMLMIIPWRPEWTENRLLTAYPGIRDLVSSGFIRGVVTGLGLLNIWIGFWEAIQYREDE